MNAIDDVDDDDCVENVDDGDHLANNVALEAVIDMNGVVNVCELEMHIYSFLFFHLNYCVALLNSNGNDHVNYEIFIT